MDPTNSTDIVVEWDRGFTASLPLRDIHKPTPTFLRQRLDIVLRNFYDKMYYYSFHIGDICFLPSLKSSYSGFEVLPPFSYYAAFQASSLPQTI
jgi:hypothetical protein